jgi:phosphate transport system protein
LDDFYRKEKTMLEEKKLIELRKELIDNAVLVETMIGKSIKGLKEKNMALLESVIKEDEPRANDYEIAIDEMCVSTIAQHQPATKPLRTILMILNISTTLERMADHAVTISESALYLISQPSVKPLLDIPRMAEVTISMLKNAIDSFVNENAALAMAVCERDSIVDALRTQIIRELISYMIADPLTIERALHLMKIASNMERIADLATNICEDVIYIVQGKVIKHHKT